MSKVMLSVLSFVVGMLCTSFVLSGSRASTVVQVPGVDLGGAEPTVPSLKLRMESSILGGQIQALDGIDCEKCVIQPQIISYGGGVFNCHLCIVHATKGLQLKGAAQNTLAILTYFGLIPGPKPIPNRPNNEARNDNSIMQIKPLENVDLVSLAGLKK
jgi:hypothetical protein